MSNHSYKKIEVVGTSADSVSDAVSQALTKVSQTVHNLDWFEVTEIRGAVKDAKPIFQVTLKVGFRLD